MTLGENAKEAIYLLQFLSELGIEDLRTVKVCNDNLEAQNFPKTLYSMVGRSTLTSVITSSASY